MTRAGTVLLPNGWSLKPAGRQTQLGDLPVQIAVHPSRADPGDPPRRLRRARGRDRRRDDRQGDRPRRAARELRRAGLVGRRQAALRRRRVRRRDLPLRPRRRPALEEDGLRVSRPQGVPGAAESAARAKRPRSTSACRPAWRSPRTARPSASPPPSAIRVARFDAESGAFQGELALEADSYPYGLASTSRASGSTSASGARPRSPSSTPTTFKVAGHWTTEEHPNEMLLAHGGKILYVANANRNTVTVIDTEAGKADRDDRHGDRPQGPAGQHAQLAGPLARRVDAVRRQRQHQQPGRRQRQGARRRARRWASSRPAGIPPRSGSPATARRSTWPTARGPARGPTATARARASPAAGDPTREYIGGLFQGTLSIIPMPGPRQMAAYSQTVYECSPLRRGDPTAVTGPPPAPGNPIPAKVGDPSPITHCRLHHQGEPHLRPGLRRHARRQRRAEPLPLPRGGHAQPPRPGPRVRAARQLLRRERGQRRRPRMVDGRLRHRLRRADLAAGLPRRPPRPLSRPRGPSTRSPGPPAATSGTGPPRRGSATAATASSSRTARRRPTRPRPRSRPSKGHFDPMFRSFDMDYPDVKRADRFLEELAGFEKAGEMPRLVILRLPNDHTSGTTPGKPTVDGLRRRQRPGAGPGRRGAEQEPVLEGDGHLRGRGRRPERLGPRRRPPDRRPGDQPVHQAALGRFDDVQHLVDAPDDGADPRPGADEPVRRRRPADVRRRSRASPTSPPTSIARPASTSNARNRRDAPDGRGLASGSNLEIEDRADDLALQRDHLEGRQGEPTRPCRRRSARRS